MLAKREDKQTIMDLQAQNTGPVSLLDEILYAARLQPADEKYDLIKRGIRFLTSMFITMDKRSITISDVFIDSMIAELDRRLSLQLDAILHNPYFQKLESTWRALKFLVDRTDFRENIRIEIFNVTKEDLLDDFEDSPEIPRSGLYRIVYTREYGQFGGQPYGAMIGDYYFSAKVKDFKLLQYIAGVAAMSHAPFIASIDASFFKLEDFRALPRLKDLKGIFETPRYSKWQSFRSSEDARYIGLCMPRFLLRLPYNPEASTLRAFNYTEDVSRTHGHYLWGNTAFAFASRLTDSFAKYRWCVNIIGTQGGGTVENLPKHCYEAMGALEPKISTEILISEKREFELAEEGFIALTVNKGDEKATFFSASSVQKPKFFAKTRGGTKEAELNYKLGVQFPYLFIVNRLAHYIKVIQRENIGSWKERVDIEKELNGWIRQYIADMDNPLPGVRSRRPLRQAQIKVEEVEGEPGWYRVELKVRPHFKYMGAFFTLSLVGKLDKQ